MDQGTTRKRQSFTQVSLSIDYTKMPFGPKECVVPPTSGLADKRFGASEAGNLEVYVVTLVIKSHTEDELMRDINLTASSRVQKKTKSCHPTSFTAHDERSPVVKWEVSRFEQVPIQFSRQVTPLVQNTQEVYEEGRLPLDYRSRRSFQRSSMQQMSALPTLVVPPTTRGATKTRRSIAVRSLNLRRLALQLEWSVRNLESKCGLPFCGLTMVGANIVAKEDNIDSYLDKTMSLIQSFDRFTIRQVHRGSYSGVPLSSFSKQWARSIMKQKVMPAGISRTAQRKRFETSKWCPLSSFVPTTMAMSASDLFWQTMFSRDSCEFMQYATRTRSVVASAYGLGGGLKSLSWLIDYFTKWIRRESGSHNHRESGY
ncbi:hypothetical protein Tco_1213940 [Tanacetum coccineum]